MKIIRIREYKLSLACTHMGSCNPTHSIFSRLFNDSESMPPSPKNSMTYIHHKAVKWCYFLFCLEKPWHVTSVSDLYAQKLMQMNGEELIACNKQCLIRVYPNCSRVDSSNYNPQEMWNYGCQIGENICALMP